MLVTTTIPSEHVPSNRFPIIITPLSHPNIAHKHDVLRNHVSDVELLYQDLRAICCERLSNKSGFRRMSNSTKKIFAHIASVL